MSDLPRKNVHDAAPRLSATEARQGEPVGRLRYILAVSLGLTVISFVVAWLFSAY